MELIEIFCKNQGVTVYTPEGNVKVVVRNIGGRGRNREANLEIISENEKVPFHLKNGEKIGFLEKYNVSVEIDNSEKTSGKYVRLNYNSPVDNIVRIAKF
jgi:hypothetical protein